MTTEAQTMVKEQGGVGVRRPSRGLTQTFTAETDGLVINKKGYGLVGISWPAVAATETITFKVGLTAATATKVHDAISIDVENAGATSISDLAEWPYIQIIFSANATGAVEVALS